MKKQKTHAETQSRREENSAPLRLCVSNFLLFSGLRALRVSVVS